MPRRESSSPEDKKPRKEDLDNEIRRQRRRSRSNDSRSPPRRDDRRKERREVKEEPRSPKAYRHRSPAAASPPRRRQSPRRSPRRDRSPDRNRDRGGRDGERRRSPRPDRRSPRPERERPGSREEKGRNERGDEYGLSKKEKGPKKEIWGKPEHWEKPKEEEIPPEEKQKVNLGLSGKLAEDTNLFRGVVIKYNEPPEAKKPKTRWRLYPFKGDEALPTLYVHRQSAYLVGRDRVVADLPVDHPSCSKQHAVLQYRSVPYTRPDGVVGRAVRPYIIDLSSGNGTFLNGEKLEAQRYYELQEKDILKFGFSSREFVILSERSAEQEGGSSEGEGDDEKPGSP
ncbi:unnamed protein product, partial [Mesorhabditis spiculigera]